jgi:hypothetical protein
MLRSKEMARISSNWRLEGRIRALSGQETGFVAGF